MPRAAIPAHGHGAGREILQQDHGSAPICIFRAAKGPGLKEIFADVLRLRLPVEILLDVGHEDLRIPEHLGELKAHLGNAFRCAGLG